MNDLGVNTCQRSKIKKFLLLIALLNTAGIIYYLFFLKANGYLPPPFFFDSSDTFMDLFNPMYWAFDDGRYTDWKSVYPPINFIVFKLLNILFLGSVQNDPEFMRQDSPLLIFGYCLIYLFLPALMLKAKSWNVFSTSDKLLIYIIIIFSSPMLFAFERGNLIILCPILLSFALSNSHLSRCLSMAFLINFKPYFVLLAFIFFIRRSWKWLMMCVLFSGLICIESGLIIDNNFLFFITNTLDFSDSSIFSLREVMAMPSSISAFSYVLKNPDAESLVSTLFFGGVPISGTGIELLKWGAIMYSFIALFLKASMARDAEIVLLLVAVITNLSNSVGGYSLIFYAPMIPVLLNMRFKILYFVLLASFAIPLDFIPILGYYAGEGYSFITDSYVRVNWTLGIGSVIRPIANIFLLIAIAHEFMFRKQNKHQMKVPNLSKTSQLQTKERSL